MFEPSFFAQNRQKLAQNTDCSLFVIAANNMMQRSGDSNYKFRQDSYFWYLSGVNTPGAVLVMAGSASFLIAPKQDRFDVISDGKINTEQLAKQGGVNSAYEYKEGWQQLTNLVKKHKKVGILDVSRSEHNTTRNSARTNLIHKLKRAGNNLKLIDVRPQLVKMRMIKQQAELLAIQKAVDITCAAFTEFKDNHLNKVTYEYEAEAAISRYFRSHGAQDAYTPIVASGKNACPIHYTNNDQPIAKNNLLLIDMGAEMHNYASDITRTFFVGKPTKRQNDVLDCVADVQRYAISLIKPGVNRREYEIAIEAYMGKVLKSLGLISRQNRGAIRKYYPHATSHHLGLDVHDVADYSQPFAENMVLTVEPGIYIPEEGIGVRIEDDIVVTKSGCEVISHQLPAIPN